MLRISFVNISAQFQGNLLPAFFLCSFPHENHGIALYHYLFLIVFHLLQAIQTGQYQLKAPSRSDRRDENGGSFITGHLSETGRVPEFQVQHRRAKVSGRSFHANLEKVFPCRLMVFKLVVSSCKYFITQICNSSGVRNFTFSIGIFMFTDIKYFLL